MMKISSGPVGHRERHDPPHGLTRSRACLPSLAVEISSELQAAPSMLIEFPFVGRIKQMADYRASRRGCRGDAHRSELPDCVGSAVIRRLCDGSEVETRTLSRTRPDTKRGLTARPGVAAYCIPPRLSIDPG
jgi:hypothetical protein